MWKVLQRMIMGRNRSNVATLVMTGNAVNPSDPTRNLVTYDSEPYGGGKANRRVLYQRCFNSWMPDDLPGDLPGPPAPAGMTPSPSESGQWLIERTDGDATTTYRNASVPSGSGQPYTEVVQAWVALASNPLVPISPVLEFTV